MSGHARLYAHGNAIHAPCPRLALAIKALCGHMICPASQLGCGGAYRGILARLLSLHAETKLAARRPNAKRRKLRLAACRPQRLAAKGGASPPSAEGGGEAPPLGGKKGPEKGVSFLDIRKQCNSKNSISRLRMFFCP